MKQNKCIVCGEPAKARYNIIFGSGIGKPLAYCSFAHGAKIHRGVFYGIMILVLVFILTIQFAPEFEDADQNRKFTGFIPLAILFLFSLYGLRTHNRVRVKEKKLIL